MDQKPNLPEQIALQRAYEAGWIQCATWAERDDLITDCDSGAYTRERDAALSKIALSAPPAQEPEAWMWKYIGPDPIGSQLKPCARALHEMDPAAPPHPKHWKPLHPLYASPLPQEPQEGKVLTEERINELAAEYGDELDQAFIFNRLGRFSAVAFARAIERELRGAQEGKAGESREGEQR